MAYPAATPISPNCRPTTMPVTWTAVETSSKRRFIEAFPVAFINAGVM